MHVLGLPPAPVEPAPSAPPSPRVDTNPDPVEQVSGGLPTGEDGLFQDKVEMPQASRGFSGGPVHSNNSALGMAREVSLEDGIEDDASFGVAEVASQQRMAGDQALAVNSTRPALDAGSIPVCGYGREGSPEPSTCEQGMADDREEIFGACGATVTVVASVCNAKGEEPVLRCEEAALQCSDACSQEFVSYRPIQHIHEQQIIVHGVDEEIAPPLSCTCHMMEGSVPEQELCGVENSTGISGPIDMLPAGLLPHNMRDLSDGLQAAALLEDTACR